MNDKQRRQGTDRLNIIWRSLTPDTLGIQIMETSTQELLNAINAKDVAGVKAAFENGADANDW